MFYYASPSVFRYSHFFGDVDIGVHVFDGTSREPRFQLALDGDRLLPVYEQAALPHPTLQHTSDREVDHHRRDTEEQQPVGPVQCLRVVFRVRHALPRMDDAADTSVLAGIATDIETGELFVNVEAERRIGDNLSVELRFRAFTNADANDSLYAIENDDYLQLGLSWYY